MTARERRALTVRFDDPQTYELLHVVAKRLGVSMNEFVQGAVRERLEQEAAGIEHSLQAALDAVHWYQQGDAEHYADAFARGEVTQDDPVRATAVNLRVDRLGIRKSFMRAVD